MTTEPTQPGQDTTQPGAGEGDKGATTTAAVTTALGGDTPGKTAGDVDADKGAKADDAKAGEGDKPKDGDKPADGKKPDDAKADGPPEKYEFTLPDGMQLDTGLLEKAEPVLRELNLTNDQANKLAGIIAEVRVSEAQAQSEAYTQQVEDWGKAARDDKEYGGAAFEKSCVDANRFIAAFGTPELNALLRDGLGNHPELIRLCARAGKAMGEDKGIDANNRVGPSKSPGEVLFDNPTSQPKTR